MNAREQVSLSEPEIECIVLATLIIHEAALIAHASEINPEWFTDPVGRSIAVAALQLNAEGHRVTKALLSAKLSPELDCDGVTRADFIAGIAKLAVSPSQLGGYFIVLRERWTRRVMQQIGSQLQYDAVSSDCDPFEAISASVVSLDTANASRTAAVAGALGEGIDELFDDIRNPKSTQLVTTGIASLNAAFNGYAPGKLYVVAGRPGMGKSAFACSSLWRTAEAGSGVAIFSLEMGRDEISARCIADAIGKAGPHYGSILKHQLSEDDGDLMAEARHKLVGLPMHVDASPSLTFMQIAGRCRQLKTRYEAQGRRLDVICIDHMGLVRPSDRYSGNKVAEAGEISGAAKALAKELNCCVLLLCQLSRKVEERDDKRPLLADLRWSGDIEQDADVVAFLYRHHYYLQQRPDAGANQLRQALNSLDFLIRKNRNGDTRDVPLWCSMGHSSIRDVAP